MCEFGAILTGLRSCSVIFQIIYLFGLVAIATFANADDKWSKLTPIDGELRELLENLCRLFKALPGDQDWRASVRGGFFFKDGAVYALCTS